MPAQPKNKLAVLVTCFNQEAIIEKTVNSLLNSQLDSDNYHVVVSDHHSTDGSYPRLKKLQEEHPNLTVGVCHQPGFVGVNRNYLLTQIPVDCNYVIFVDGDDPQQPDYLENIFRGLDGADVYQISNFCETWPGKEVIKKAPGYPNVMFKVYKKTIIENLRFDESVEIGEDVIFNCAYPDKLKPAKQIRATYQLNRLEENISLTKNKNIEKRYNQEKHLFMRIKEYNDNKNLDWINNKIVDLIQFEILLDLPVKVKTVNYKYLDRKHLLSYILYRTGSLFSFIGGLSLYKWILQKKIGHKF